MKNTALALTLLLAAAGCARQEAAVAQQKAPGPAAAAATTATPAPSAANESAPAPSTNLLAGKVLETFNSGGYTYLRIRTASGEAWAAVNEVKVKKGDDVSVAAQMTMEDFKSSSLNRTFDKIVFGTMGNGGDHAGDGAAAAPAAMAAMAGKMPPAAAAAGAVAMGTPAQHMKVPDVDVKVEKVAGGNTVAELWAQRTALKGKEVVVRGKVVKFLGGIMGTNWMHLQDGTGSGDKGDNDITVTTDEKVAVGDVVTIRGTLAADKDFGAGYKYAVIVEKAKVTK